MVGPRLEKTLTPMPVKISSVAMPFQVIFGPKGVEEVQVDEGTMGRRMMETLEGWKGSSSTVFLCNFYSNHQC